MDQIAPIGSSALTCGPHHLSTETRELRDHVAAQVPSGADHEDAHGLALRRALVTLAHATSLRPNESSVGVGVMIQMS
jgi:hypothetical protein